MILPWQRWLALLLCLLAGPLVAWPLDGTDSAELNRRALERWRQQPEAFAWLREQARIFAALTPEQQLRLLKLDEDLHQQRSAEQARLLDVLKRYADWLTTLSPEERRQIQDAPHRAARLQRIREIRERHWIAAQPKKVRDELAGLAGQPRADALARLHQDERERQRDWRVAATIAAQQQAGAAPPQPTRLDDLSERDRDYVEHYLRPRLSKAEWEALKEAEKMKWPRFARLLVAFADRYPQALKSPHGPSHVNQLPKEIVDRLKNSKGKIPASLKGGTPDFSRHVLTTLNARKRKFTMPNEMWPTHRSDLSPAVREFLQKGLEPVLSAAEKRELHDAEGDWPIFPETIQDLAAQHYLVVPWQTFPAPRERWDGYRLTTERPAPGLPPVAHYTLELFAQLEPSAARPGLPPRPDAAAWERLTRRYFEHHPEELERLRQVDQRWAGEKKKGGKGAL
jgi:hypothetical protein